MENKVPLIWQLNDCDWWMAPTLEEAIQGYMAEFGVNREEACPDEAECLPMTEEEMKNTAYITEEGNSTFWVEYQKMLSKGLTNWFFASTEF